MPDLKDALVETVARYRRSREGQPLVFALLSFAVSFSAARLAAHASRAGVSAFHTGSVAGRRLHHSFWGVLALVLAGYCHLVGLPRHMSSSVVRNGLAILYGSSAALTLDEFALWLHLGEKHKSRSDYWSREGRKSIWASMGFGLLLLATLLGDFLKTKPEREPPRDSSKGFQSMDHQQASD